MKFLKNIFLSIFFFGVLLLVLFQLYKSENREKVILNNFFLIDREMVEDFYSHEEINYVFLWDKSKNRVLACHAEFLDFLFVSEDGKNFYPTKRIGFEYSEEGHRLSGHIKSEYGAIQMNSISGVRLDAGWCAYEIFVFQGNQIILTAFWDTSESKIFRSLLCNKESLKFLKAFSFEDISFH